MAATKPSAQRAAGIVKMRRKGRWFMMAWSVHDVFGKPFAPFGGLLGPQFGVDVDLLLPLFGVGEDAGKFCDLGIELGVENGWTALFQLRDLGLNLRVIERVDE